MIVATPLLDDVGELVGEQAPSYWCPGDVCKRAEEDVIANRGRPRCQVGREFRGPRVGMDPDARQVVSEGALMGGSLGLFEWSPAVAVRRAFPARRSPAKLVGQWTPLWLRYASEHGPNLTLQVYYRNGANPTARDLIDKQRAPINGAL
jgi:hypothetical protein